MSWISVWTQESRTGHSSPGVSHQHWVHEDHLRHPSDNSGPNSTYGAVGLLCHKDTLLAHVQYLVLQDAQIPLYRAAFQAIPQPILHGITQEPDFVHPLAELQEIPVSPLSVKVPLYAYRGPSEWQHLDLCTSSLFRCSLTWSFTTEVSIPCSRLSLWY